MFVGLPVLSWCYVTCCNISAVVNHKHLSYLHISDIFVFRGVMRLMRQNKEDVQCSHK